MSYTTYLLNVCILKQITVINKHGQSINRRVSVTAAKALPAFGFVNGDDLEYAVVKKTKVKGLKNTRTHTHTNWGDGSTKSSPPSCKTQGH